MIAEIIAAISAAGRYVIGMDGFNRVNGPLGNAEIGGAWSVNNGTVTIVSFKAKGGTSGTTNMATLLMPRNVVPLVASQKKSDLLKTVLDGVSAKLTTKALIEMNTAVSENRCGRLC